MTPNSNNPRHIAYSRMFILYRTVQIDVYECQLVSDSPTINSDEWAGHGSIRIGFRAAV